MYKSINVNFRDLKLDEQNPRFVTNRDQVLTPKEIMEYLIKYENVIELAENIKEYGGLIPGERLLVVEENNGFVVLEGNRRTAAIELLLNPGIALRQLSLSNNDKLKVKEFKESVSKSLKKHLSSFQVDIVSSRDNAIYSLTERHIDGIKKWSQISKMYFYKQHFDSGMNLSDLKGFTGESPRTIADTLRKYSYLRYVLTSYRDMYPNGKFYDVEIETQIPTELIIQRVFNSLRDRLNFQFDNSYNFITSHYNDEELRLLKEILAGIAYLYWDLEKINTRNLNKVEDFDNVFFEGKHDESSSESLKIGLNIKKLTSSLASPNKKVYKNEKEDTSKKTNNEDNKNKKKANYDDFKKKKKEKDKVKSEKQEEYRLYLDVKPSKTKVKLYNDFDLMTLIIKATDSNHVDLKSKVRFNSEEPHLIDGNIFSGDATEGVYQIQAKLVNNGKTVSRRLVIEVYTPKVTFKTTPVNNSLFTSVTAFSLDNEISIDINNTVNGLIEEMQSLKNPEQHKLMISASVRQLIELSVTKIISDKDLDNQGNPKNNLHYLVNNVFRDNQLFEDICNGENKIKFRTTRNLINSIDTNQLWDYLNLITHDSYSSIYSELVDKVNKQITPLLVIFHNYLGLSDN